MTPSALSLIPPLIVLLIAGYLQRIIPALLCGIAAAAVIATRNPLTALQLIATRIFGACDVASLQSWEQFSHSDTLLLFVFLIALSIITVFSEISGSASAYTTAFKSRLKTPNQVARASIGLSLILFVDDYFSTLTVGAVMRPLADAAKMSRARLALLVDTFAAPLVLITPASSWIAFILGQLSKSGITAPAQASSTTLFVGDPFEVYLATLPFISYSFIALIVMGLFVFTAWPAFGPLAKHEAVAQETGNLCNGKPHPTTPPIIVKSHATLFDFLFPICLLSISLFVGMLYSGSWVALGGTRSFLAAFQAAAATRVLAYVGLLTLCASFCYLASRRLLTGFETKKALKDGFFLMLPTLIILTLAWAFGSMLQQDLGTGTYLATLLTGSIPPYLFPLMTFFVAGTLSAVLGTSWGVIALILPLCLPILYAFSGGTSAALMAEQTPLLYPFLGAVFSGAIMGDHLSPFASTSAVIALSTGSHLFDHMITQAPYGICFIVGTIASISLASALVAHTSLIIAGLASLAAGCCTALICAALFTYLTLRRKQ